jgi:hypothetical protein
VENASTYEMSKDNKDDIINVTKVVETKSIFMRANALKMASGYHWISRQENRIDVNDVGIG